MWYDKQRVGPGVYPVPLSTPCLYLPRAYLGTMQSEYDPVSDSRAYLEVPAGTVGGRMAGTCRPRASRAALAATAAASAPTMSGTMGLAASQPSAAPRLPHSASRCRLLQGSYTHQVQVIATNYMFHLEGMTSNRFEAHDARISHIE